MTEDQSKVASIGAGVGAGAATGVATGAVGAGAALAGFSSPGITAGSVAASAMSIAWKTGVGIPNIRCSKCWYSLHECCWR